MQRAGQTSEYLATFETGIRMVRVLVRRLPILIGVFAAAFAVSFLVKSQTPVLYEANALVLFAPPPYRIPKLPGQGAADEFSRMMPQPLSVQDYEIVAKSPPVLKTLRREVDWRQDGDPIPMIDLRERIRAFTPVIKKTNTELQYSPILTLTVTAPEPESAAKYVNTWADIVVGISKDHTRSATTGVTAFLASEFDKAGDQYETSIGASAAQFESVLQQLNDAKRLEERTIADLEIDHAAQTAALASELQIESWEAKLETIGEVLDTLRQDLALTEVEMASRTNAVARIDERLAGLEPTIRLNRGLSETALPLVALEQRRTADGAALPSVVGEEINEVHTLASDRRNEIEAELAGYEARRTMLLDSIGRSQAEREMIVAEIEDRKTKLLSLTRRLDAEMVAKKLELGQAVERLQLHADLEKAKVEKQMESQSAMYSELNARMLGARLAEAEIQPDLRVLVRGIATPDPLPRRRVFTAGGIAIALTMLAAIVLLLMEAIRQGGEFRRRTAEG